MWDMLTIVAAVRLAGSPAPVAAAVAGEEAIMGLVGAGVVATVEEIVRKETETCRIG